MLPSSTDEPFHTDEAFTRYDNGTQVYDTSEKARIPAWTDRILYYGKELDLSRYNRAELMASDHRPGKYFLFDPYFFHGIDDTFISLCHSSS